MDLPQFLVLKRLPHADVMLTVGMSAKAAALHLLPLPCTGEGLGKRLGLMH